MAPPVCITGANGFIGGHITEEFLKHGVDVHGTVRDPKAKKNQFLLDIEKKYEGKGGGKLTLFAADLNKSGDFDEAVKGCEVVVHVAASVVTHYKSDPFTEVINPSVNGVKHVVSACKLHNVRRIVYTSSVATIICGEDKRSLATRGKAFTEDMWNTHLTPTYGTYNYSKIKAEEELNALWKGEMISLLPAWVMGPQQNNQVTSSMQVVRALVNHEYKLAPPLFADWVDVRDVARAHFFAAFDPKIKNGRYNLSQNTSLSTGDFGQAINKAFPAVKAPEKLMPWGVLWAASFWDKRISTYMLYEKATKMSPIDNTKLPTQGFEWKHTDIVECMRDCVTSFWEHGISKKPAGL